MSASTDLARIKEVQGKARQGESGEWRKDYTRQYRQMLEQIFEEIRQETHPYFDLPEEGITCRKCCTHCCEHFISVPVSHALLITDYLYTSDRALSAFLRGYDNWLSAVEDNPQAAAILSSLEEYTTSAAVVKPYPQELLSAYHACTVPCPFLDAGQCSIYPVRPLCCASYFAVSPPDLCRADSNTLATVLQIAPSQANLRRMTFLADPRLSLHQEPLPKLVYKLLTTGLPEVTLEVERLFNSESPGK